MTQLSPEEYHSLSQAIREPDFPGLFSGYLEEVSSMENRRELVDYMLSLDAAGEVPKGKILVRPLPWICFETKSSAEPQRGIVFVNVVHANELDRARVDTVSRTVQIPLIVSPPRLEQSSNGGSCVSVDVLVGTGTKDEALQRGMSFLVVLSNMVIENLNSSHFKRNPLSKDIRLRRDWTFRDNLSADLLIPILVDKNHVATDSKKPVKTSAESACVTESELRALQPKQGEKCQSKEEDNCPLSKEATYQVCYVHSNPEEPPDGFRVKIFLPNIRSSSEITIKPQNDPPKMIVITGDNLLEIPIPPRGIEIESGKAVYDKQKSTLTITYTC